MEDPSRTNQELIKEISALKQKIKEMEQSESEPKRVSGELRESEEYFKAIIQNASDIILIVDKLGTITYASPSVERILGYGPDELIGKRILDLIVSDDKPKAIADFGRALLTKEVLIPNVFRIGHKNGTERILEGVGKNLLDNPIVAGFVMNVRDITERKQVENSLRESEERYRTILENIEDGYFEVDIAGKFTFFNDSVCRILGYTRAEMMGMNNRQYTDKENSKILYQAFNKVFRTGEPSTGVGYEIIRKDGTKRYVESSASFIRNSSGQPIGFRGIIRNITERKREEQEEVILSDIGRLIGSTLDINEVYERFATEAKKLIPFDRLALNLNNYYQNTITIAYVFGLNVPGRRPGDSFPLQGSVNELLARTRTGMLFHPTNVDELTEQYSRLVSTFQEGIRSLMSVPLISRNEVIGVLHFRSKTLNAYTDRDLRLAERIGIQIAGAIANAQLFSDLKKTEQELKESEQRYRDLSIVDDLTQLYNSRHFYFQLKIELDRSNRYEQPLTLLLLDLDNFKTFNDVYGHVEGDQVLMRLGQVVKRCLRETDFAYRYGGEEFTILLPMTTSADGTVIAERIRMEFKKETFSPAPGQDVHVTVSIGLAQYKPQEEMKTFVHRVDQLMYQGKKNGKDRVCSEP